MSPADEPTPTDADATDTPVGDAPDEGTTEDTTVEESTVEDSDSTDDPDGTTEGDDEGVEAEGTLLEQSQATIDDAREAVKKVAATDAIGEDATGAGDLPAFADSVEGVEKPDPDDA